jgi:murein biosynthesis integral membrane protein MurJ
MRGSSSLRAAGLVSALTLLSRVLGVVREQVFAALLGAGMHADAFQIGFRIPNLLRDLFAEGALSAAFVPTYARLVAEEGRPSAQRMACRLLTLLAVILGAVVLVGMALAGPLVAALAPGFEAVSGKWELTVRLTRIMLPFLPLVSFAAVAMGMLNAEGKYGPAALAPAMFNVMTIVWTSCGCNRSTRRTNAITNAAAKRMPSTDIFGAAAFRLEIRCFQFMGRPCLLVGRPSPRTRARRCYALRRTDARARRRGARDRVEPFRNR